MFVLTPAIVSGLCFGLRDLDDQVCLLSCESNLECRSNDGYICDSDNTCFPGGSNAASGGSDGNGTTSIGGACDEDNDCRDENAVCLPPGGASNNFVDGYCYLPGCSESRPCRKALAAFKPATARQHASIPAKTIPNVALVIDAMSLVCVYRAAPRGHAQKDSSAAKVEAASSMLARRRLDRFQTVVV